MSNALPKATERLFDAVSDIVYFVKDAEGRYVAVNDTLVKRLGRRNKKALIGRSAAELFPPPLAARIAAQDQAVLARGRAVAGELELHIYPRGEEGWCLTWKEPVRDARGQITGLTGISRDIRPIAPGSGLDAVQSAIDHIRDSLDRPLRLPVLANMASLSVWQFDQRIRALYGLSAGQFITRSRIDRACRLLRDGDAPISEIALACGYGDQAAFTRQFHKSTGLTPRAYRLTTRSW